MRFVESLKRWWCFNRHNAKQMHIERRDDVTGFRCDKCGTFWRWTIC
jgi:hypothetical protein